MAFGPTTADGMALVSHPSAWFDGDDSDAAVLLKRWRVQPPRPVALTAEGGATPGRPDPATCSTPRLVAELAEFASTQAGTR